MGVQQREGGVVGDEADIVDVVGNPLQLGHERPEPDRRGGGSCAVAASTARAKAS